MKTSIIQMDIAWNSPSVNVSKANAMIDNAPEADLYVLPEMFSTGFATCPEGIAEDENCDTLLWMKRKGLARCCRLKLLQRRYRPQVPF